MDGPSFGGMEDAFLVVVIGVSLLALVGAVVALATSGGAYDRIGRDGTAPDDAPGAPDDAAAEVREVVMARNARRVARGEPPLDVEAEVARRLRDG